MDEVAVFGGGCFWCTEAVFKILKGIKSVEPGYAGGASNSSGQAPTYEDVSSGSTGHAEVIRVEFDPSQISYKDLLTVFFGTHDPTTLNRQGHDVGTQYRSIILYTSEDQKQEAEQFIRDINASHPDGDPVVTTVEPLKEFYPAEDYHKDYYAKNKNQGYCQVVINPKLQKVQKEFAALLNKA
jgi:peptide-methionine (S)-S-oxide reductase